MNIRQKMVLIVVSSMLFIAIPGTAIIYEYVQHNILTRESQTLEKITENLISTASQRFLESSVKLKSVAYLLEKELSKPIQKKELSTFYQIMERNSDGVWRNRKSDFNGTLESGIFLPKNPNENDVQKIQHLRIKSVLDTFGAAANRRMENVWYLSPDRSEIIFDKNQPNFAFDQQADNDYTQTPWITYTTPQNNPNRELRFTPPLFDPVPKVWMVSAIYPLYVNGKWIGSIGEDMPLTKTFEFMFQSEQLYEDTQHFLIDNQGNFVLAGKWQKELEATAEGFKFNYTNQQPLLDLFDMKLTNKPQVLARNLLIDGRRYIAIGMRLEPLDWHYYKLVPVDKIMASTRELFIVLSGMILFISGLSSLLIFIVSGNSITKRIKTLTNAMDCYANDHNCCWEYSKLSGNDEIAKASQAFMNMVDEIEQKIAEIKRIEFQLSKSEEVLRFALEGSGDGVWDWHIPTNEVFFSDSWKSMIGYQTEELSDNYDTFDSLLHPDDKNRVSLEIQNCFENKTDRYRVIFRLRCKEGNYKWVLARGMIVSRSENNEPLRMVGTHTDITETKKIEERLRSLTVAIEQSPTSIVITDLDANLIYVNPQFTRVTGYESSEILGKNPRILQSGLTAKETYVNLWNTVTNGQVWRGELTNLRKNQEVYYEEAHVAPVFNEIGEIIHYVGVKFEITDRKRNEQALIKAKELAESATKAKSLFLANMSHEIRTPMNGILGLLQLTLNKELSPEVRDYLEKIQTSATSLLKTLNNILDFAKIEAGRITIEQRDFNLIEILKQLSNLFMLEATQKGLQFEIETAANLPFQLKGDALRLQQVLSNLIGNAIKFTSNGRIFLKVECLGKSAKQANVKFSIIDTGIGMSAFDLENLFQPFNQGDNSASRRFDGVGLGLAISRDLLKLMGSNLQINSELGNGTTVSFELIFVINSEDVLIEPSKIAISQIEPEINPFSLPIKKDKNTEILLHKLLAELDYLLAENDLIHSKLLDEIEQYLSEDKIQIFQEVRKNIKNINYEQAHITLKTLL